MFIIEEELKKLPAKPGVYIMHDEKDEIIYVGKAISLKNRVRQYFQSSRNKSSKIIQMVSKIRRFEYIITDSELEALVLECNLIKEHRPRYNTMLKDDKSYPYIKVTVSEQFPRVLMSRNMKKDKSKYFGPYTNLTAVKDTLELVHKLFKIRTCNRNLPRDIGKDRACLNYHIKQCSAPCQGCISREEYMESVRKVMDLLNGKYDDIIKNLESSMYEASEKMDFETAAEYRDLMNSVKHIAEKQKITSDEDEDRDVIAMASDGEDAVIQVFFVRGGKLLGREHFHMDVGSGEERPQILAGFVKQYYAGTPFIPKELLLQYEIEDAELIEEWLTSRKGQKVYLKVPKKGQKEKLVELAEKNASIVLIQDSEKIKREEQRTRGALKYIAELLELDDISRVEAFDISNTSGFESVGSMVVYEDGKPKRNDYRKFKIKSVEGPDDYASMKEVLTRRFIHGMDEQKLLEEKNISKEMGSFTKFPDLIMMDGGRGQVNIALGVLDELGLNIPVCGMVKDDNHRTRGLYYNNVEIPIDRHSEGFKLITRIQDEAHRFAITFHRDLRSKKQVHSILDDIPQIGEARRKVLMKNYKSIDAIKEASISELEQLPGMNEKAATEVYNFFHKNN
ncbi:MAG: excinuclease ABC subunit UvrC [Lachnospiraceae bacterium]|nr:excinuclease ABC subunit UvrC [Lachnospiraceae bacterium]